MNGENGYEVYIFRKWVQNNHFKFITVFYAHVNINDPHKIVRNYENLSSRKRKLALKAENKIITHEYTQQALMKLRNEIKKLSLNTSQKMVKAELESTLGNINLGDDDNIFDIALADSLKSIRTDSARVSTVFHTLVLKIIIIKK